MNEYKGNTSVITVITTVLPAMSRQTSIKVSSLDQFDYFEPATVSVRAG